MEYIGDVLYDYASGLYANLTNRCPCRCEFCIRTMVDSLGDADSLWLKREPSVDEVKELLKQWDLSRYTELVFCGFGEPTLRLDAVLEIADFVHRTYGKPVRLNTNGLANLEYGRDITPLLQGKIDILSVSLNTPDREKYYALTRNKFGISSFDGMLDFVRRAKAYVPEIVLSTVATTLTAEEEQKCRAICEALGVTYRIRPFEN